jgi:hypothetical protein
MFHVKAIAAAFLALSSTVVMAGDGDKQQIGDAQMACAAAATKDYLTTNSAFVVRATANGLMSVDDRIAQRRLVEGYCKRWAACLVTNVDDAGMRETAYRATFSSCLEFEAKPDDPT